MGLSPTPSSQQDAPPAPRHLALPPSRVANLLSIPWTSKAPAQAPVRDVTKAEEPSAPLLSPFPPQGPAHNTIATLDQIKPYVR